MLVIDCYNVLHTTMPPMLAGLDEGRLCAALGRTAWAARGVIVVADGRPKPLRAERSDVDGVELRFSGPSRNADTVIIEIINDHTSPRRVTVVSSDRQIRAAARRRRCNVWTSEQFITKLVEQLRRGGGGRAAASAGAGKPSSDLSDEETEAWLAEFGMDPEQAMGLSSADLGIELPADDEADLNHDDSSDEDKPDGREKKPDGDDPFNIPGIWPPPGMG